VNDNVRAARVDAGARLATAITNPTFWTAVLMIPESAPADATVSVSVATEMPVVLPEVPSPIVKPVRVTLTSVPAGKFPTAVVMTMEVAVGAAEVAVGLDDPLKVMVGVAVVAKKPVG